VSVRDNEHGYVTHGSLDGPPLAPYPPWVQTAADTRRWDLAYGIAEGLSRMFEKTGEPDARWVWYTTRALYHDRTIPTGDGSLVEAADDALFDRAGDLLAELERRRPADHRDRDQLDSFLEALADYFEHILGPVPEIDYEREVAEAWSVAARLASARSRREHARGRLATVHKKLGSVHATIKRAHEEGVLRDKIHRAHVIGVGSAQSAIAGVIVGRHPAEHAIHRVVKHEGRRNIATGAAAALAPDPREAARVGVAEQATRDVLDNHERAKMAVEKSLDAARWAHEHQDVLQHAGKLLHGIARAKGLAGARIDDADLDEGASISGAMVALYPQRAARERLAAHAGEGGEPAGQMHVTLKFLGEDAGELSDELKDELAGSLERFARSEKPLEGKTGKVDTFKPTDEGETPVFAHARVPGIQGFRERLVDALPDGVMEDTHPSYVPHLTLKYADGPDHGLGDLEPVPLRFDKVHLVVGGERRAFPLGG
jgi:2'-5' RNA ligase